MDGWVGSHEDLFGFLTSEGADQTDGRFHVAGAGGVVSFLGADEEYCVDGAALYFVGGEPRPLAAGLRRDGRGLGVVVI